MDPFQQVTHVARQITGASDWSVLVAGRNQHQRRDQPAPALHEHARLWVEQRDRDLLVRILGRQRWNRGPRTTRRWLLRPLTDAHIGLLRWSADGDGRSRADISPVAGWQPWLHPAQQFGNPQMMDPIPASTVGPVVQRHALIPLRRLSRLSLASTQIISRVMLRTETTVNRNGRP